MEEQLFYDFCLKSGMYQDILELIPNLEITKQKDNTIEIMYLDGIEDVPEGGEYSTMKILSQEQKDRISEAASLCFKTKIIVK